MHPTRSTKFQQQRCVHNRAANIDSYDFFNVLTGPELLDQVEDLLPDHRVVTRYGSWPLPGER